MYDAAINLARSGEISSSGACSLVTVMYYWGYGSGGEYLPQIKEAISSYTGPYYERIAAYAHSLGLRAEVATGNITFIKENLRRGCPVIILDHGPFFGFGGENVSDHYRVVSGYDATSFTSQDPSADWYRIISYDDFAETWNMNVTLVITPDNQTALDDKSAWQENNNIYWSQHKTQVAPSAQIIIISATFVSGRHNYLDIAFNWTGPPVFVRRLLVYVGSLGGYTKWYGIWEGLTIGEGINSLSWLGFPLGWYDTSAQLYVAFFDAEGNTPFRSASIPVANITT